MAIHIRRREFTFTLGGAAAAWPLAAHTQQPAMPMVGFLHQGALEPNALSLNRFRGGVQDSGFVEGRNVTLELRWADGKYDQLPTLAADLVRRQPVAIAAALLPAARAAKAITATIPIVFITGSDPIETKLVTSLNRPSENVTGVSLFSVPLIAKRLELLHELIPGAPVIAVLVNPDNPNAEANERGVENAARAIGLRVEFTKASSDEDFEAAFAIIQRQAGAMIVSADGFYAGRRDRIVALAARHAIPTMYFQREFVPLGGLISYGSDTPGMYRQAGLYIGRILKGAKPADLPVLQPTKFELALNLKTARALGIEVPPMLLARADEVIE
jgi:putative tryptophan/tyrosine transport system substrate-binding protein